jgi:hypothetical protein
MQNQTNAQIITSGYYYKQLASAATPGYLNSDASRNAKALAWAEQMGYPVPPPPSGCLTASLWIAAFTGLCFGVIPGLVIFYVLMKQEETRQRQVDSVVTKWVDAGSPLVELPENTRIV